MSVQSTPSIVKQYQGVTMTTTFVAIAYRKFIWKNDQQPLDNLINQNDFMRAVVKVEKTVVISSLTAAAGLFIGLLMTKSFVVLTIASPLIIGVTIVAIYSLRHQSKIPDAPAQIIYIRQMNQQEFDLCNAYCQYGQAKSLNVGAAAIWTNDLAKNQDAVKDYWRSLSFGDLIKERNNVFNNYLFIYAEYTLIIHEKNQEMQQMSFWELAALDIDFKALPQDLFYIQIQYEQVISNTYRAEYLQEILDPLDSKSSIVNPHLVDFVLNIASNRN